MSTEIRNGERDADPLNDRIAATADSIRKARGMSLRQVVAATGDRVSLSRIAALFAGRQEWTARYLRLVSDALQVTPAILVGGPETLPTLGVPLFPEDMKLLRLVHELDVESALRALTEAVKAARNRAGGSAKG